MRLHPCAEVIGYNLDFLWTLDSLLPLLAGQEVECCICAEEVMLDTAERGTLIIDAQAAENAK